MLNADLFLSVCSAGILFGLTGGLLYLKAILKRRWICGCSVKGGGCHDR